jgi:ABC-type transport system substrate-binding protein
MEERGVMASSYWTKVVSNRISRRRALAATGAGALGAAFLAACGSDNDSGSSGSTGGSTGGSKSNSILATPQDTTSQAKAGGVIKDYYTAELTHMDALLSNSASTVNLISVFVYPRLMKFKTVPAGQENDGSQLEGEAATSYELSPDKMTLTFKLRQGMKWDSRAPTNGRPLDASDVLFSWKKFGDLNPSAPNMVYNAERSPGAAVETVTAPDASTIVMKLRKPDVALLTLLAGWDQLYIMPKESDGGFDPKSTARGHGPWQLDEYVPSSHTNWSKNPNYYNTGRPFPDKLERALVPEFATRLAQFKAGNIHTDIVQNAQQEVVQLKKDMPKALVFQAPSFNPTSSPNVYFGYEGNSIFRDVRVRRAMSMAIDNEAFADTIENRDSFAKDGIDIEVAFNTVLSAAWGDYWLDRNDAKAFGDSAKYLKYNPTEAKSLLSAAGYGNGVDFDFFFNQEQTYGPAYGAQVEIFHGMFEEVGLRAKLNGLPYNQWQPIYHYGYIPANYKAGTVHGFNGIGLGAERQRYTAGLSLYGLMHPEGDAFHGAVNEQGTNSAIEGNPKLNTDLDKLRFESDREKAISLAHDIIKYATDQVIFIPKPSTSKFFTVWNPILANNFAFNSSTVGPNIWAESRINWWIDQSKA